MRSTKGPYECNVMDSTLYQPNLYYIINTRCCKFGGSDRLSFYDPAALGTRVWIKINLFDLIPGSISIFIAQKSYGQDFIIPPLINWDYYLHAITHHHHPNGFLFLWFYHSSFSGFYLLITPQLHVLLLLLS